jgi:hypothetical protein
MDRELETRVFREKALTDRICLGILKTDQWKPNSKMNQGTSIPSTPTLFFHALPQERGEKREEKIGDTQ